jgi:hypothetical protein
MPRWTAMHEDKPSAGAWKHPPRKRASGFPILFFIGAAIFAVPLGIVIGHVALTTAFVVMDVLNPGEGK